MRIKKNKNRRKSIFGSVGLMIFICTISVVYVWLHISLVQLGYRVKKREVALNNLKDTRDRLECRVAGLKSPANIEKLLRLAKLDLKVDRKTRVVRVRS